MLNVVQKSLFVFIFLNIASSRAMQNEQEIANNKILEVVNIVLKNDKFENNDVEKIKNFIAEGHIDPNFRINIQLLHRGTLQKYHLFKRLKFAKQIPLLHLAVAYKQTNLTNFLLEHGADSNIRGICISGQDGETSLDVLLRHPNPFELNKFDKSGMMILRNLLKHKADINVGNYRHENHLLKNAIFHDNMLAILNDHGVMINKQNSQIVLQEAIKQSLNYKNGLYYSNTVKDLLRYTEASIDTDNENNGNTIFHSIASNVELSQQGLKKAINTMQIVLTHARQQDWTQTIKTALLVFNRLNEESKFRKNNFPQLPREMQILIFSKLPEEYFKNSSGLLYKIVFPNDYQKYYTIQAQIKNHVEWIDEILQKKNKQEKTASQILVARTNDHVEGKHNPHTFLSLYFLMSGTRLIEDLWKNPDMLNPGYVATNQKEEKLQQNLIYQMIQCKALTLMQPKISIEDNMDID